MTTNKKIRIFRIVWILFVISIFFLLYSLYKPYLSTPPSLRHFDVTIHAKLKPSGTLGQGLGIAGAILMILCVIPYSFRKRVEGLERLGSLSFWLEVHIFLGILGSLLILFHSALKFNGLIGFGFWLMVFVIISGIFGRVFFGQIFGVIVKKYELLQKMDIFLERDLRSVSEKSPIIRKAMEIKASNFPSSTGLISSVREWMHIKKEQAQLMNLIDERYQDKGSEDYHALKKWSTDVIGRLEEVRTIPVLNLNLSILNKWILIHELCSYLLFILLVVHVFITVYWGYRWIF